MQMGEMRDAGGICLDGDMALLVNGLLVAIDDVQCEQK